MVDMKVKLTRVGSELESGASETDVLEEFGLERLEILRSEDAALFASDDEQFALVDVGLGGHRDGEDGDVLALQAAGHRSWVSRRVSVGDHDRHSLDSLAHT